MQILIPDHHSQCENKTKNTEKPKRGTKEKINPKSRLMEAIQKPRQPLDFNLEHCNRATVEIITCIAQFESTLLKSNLQNRTQH